MHRVQNLEKASSVCDFSWYGDIEQTIKQIRFLTQMSYMQKNVENDGAMSTEYVINFVCWVLVVHRTPLFHTCFTGVLCFLDKF